MKRKSNAAPVARAPDAESVRRAPGAKRYDRLGLLALAPHALQVVLDDEPACRDNVRVGPAEVVTIQGPLDHHTRPKSPVDSYDAIRARFTEACASDAPFIVMKLDSPGGAVGGCFELARDLRLKCAAAGKKLIAYVEGQACSACYALASAAEEIVLPESGVVGSIGVLDVRIDQTKANAAMGLLVVLTSSGARKGDGHPSEPVTERELVERQALVDSLAGIFFDLVSDHRGRPAKTYAALEARVLHGAAAVKAGLADRVQSFDSLIVRLSGAKDGTMKKSKYEEARNALKKVAATSGPDAARARRALKAMRAEGRGNAHKSVQQTLKSAVSAPKIKGPVASAADPELTRIDRQMLPWRAVAEKAERRGTTLYLGRAPDHGN